MQRGREACTIYVYNIMRTEIKPHAADGLYSCLPIIPHGGTRTHSHTVDIHTYLRIQFYTLLMRYT